MRAITDYVHTGIICIGMHEGRGFWTAPRTFKKPKQLAYTNLRSRAPDDGIRQYTEKQFMETLKILYMLRNSPLQIFMSNP